MTPLLTLLALGCSSKSDPDDARPPDETGITPADTDYTTPPGPTGSTGDTGALPVVHVCGELGSVSGFGGPGRDSTFVPASGADGSLYAGASTDDTMTLDRGGPAETTIVAQGADAVLMRFAPDGSFAWARQIASAGADLKLAGTSDGGVVAAGNFLDWATFAVGQPDAVAATAVSDYDGFVARFDAAGNLSWVAQFGGAGRDVTNSVVVLPDDAVVVVGAYLVDMTFGAGGPGETVLALDPASFRNAFVARFEPDGTFAWAESVGGAWSTQADAAALDPVTGEIAVVGALLGPGAATFPGAPPIAFEPVGAEGFLARWDPAGGARSVVRFGGYPYDVDVGPDGGVVVGGDYLDGAVFGAGEPNETTLTTVATSDAFAARFAPDGTLGWVAATRSPLYGRPRGRGIAATTDGGAVLVGDFYDQVQLGVGEPGEISFTAPEDFNGYVARFDASGALGCAVHVSGDGYQYGRGVVRLADGTFATTGTVDDTSFFAADTVWATRLDTRGGEDGYLASWWF